MSTKKKAAPKAKKPASVEPQGYDSLPQAHKQFVDEYLKDHNGTKAYKRVPGFEQVTDRSATTLAARLLSKVGIQQALSERAAAVKARCEMSADRVILEAARLATFDIRNLFREDGSMKLPHEIDDNTAAAISAIEVNELFDGTGADRKLIGQVKKIRVVDKRASVELAMKHLNLLTERIHVTGHESLLELLK